MKNWLALVLVGFASTCQAFWDPPTIAPEAPAAGAMVSVIYSGGDCDALSSDPRYPQVTRNGQAVRVLMHTIHQTSSELCFLPVLSVPVEIGAFEAGAYTLTVDVLYGDIFGIHVDTLGVLPLNVSGSPSGDPIGAPALSGFGLLTLAIALVVAVRFRRFLPGAALALTTAYMQPSPIEASELDVQAQIGVEIMLTAAPGAPTAEQIVNYYGRPEGPPPLSALRQIAVPVSAHRALTQRPEGDYARFLESHPDNTRAQVERIVVLKFPPNVDASAIAETLRVDPFIVSAVVRPVTNTSSVDLQNFQVTDELVGTQALAFSTPGAWNISPGTSLVAILDTGLSVNHPALRQFTSTPSGDIYAGGNFIPAGSRDVGLAGFPEPPGFNYDDVDEAKKVTFQGSCNGFLPPQNAGHGTHVAGLVAANALSGQGVSGACRHCGIIVEKSSISQCIGGSVHLAWNGLGENDGLNAALSHGAQVLSLSFGGAEANPHSLCENYPTYSECLILQDANSRDIITVASSGNDRARIDFPASTPGVIAAGGLASNTSLNIWDESPGVAAPAGCPPLPSGTYIPQGHEPECGSNYTKGTSLPKQELVASAKAVLSTTYYHYNWTDRYKCGDGYPGPAWGNGVGECTGTSMSAPQIAGIVGLLRSINPLAPKGTPAPATGIRGVLATTTFEKIANPSYTWDIRYGYGRPNAEAGAAKMLGTIRGRRPRNRVTPLFRMYNSNSADFADTTSPQFAVSLKINQKLAWGPHASGDAIPGYGMFPYQTNLGLPKAKIYVLTTPYRPRPTWPALKPLYLMSHKYASGWDYLLATTETEILGARGAGYELWNIQGYIYDCTTNCPPGTSLVFRKYNSTNEDCAVFLASEQSSTFSSYNTVCPGMTSTIIGAAYPPTDSDGDGLVDGFEYVAGTNINLADSDGTGGSDAAEYPMIDIPVSDPCSGSTGATNCYVNDVIFQDEFSAI